MSLVSDLKRVNLRKVEILIDKDKTVVENHSPLEGRSGSKTASVNGF
jgi:hypothetical protein